MALAGAWHITVQQFHLWRPLCRLWPLRSEVREHIVRLGCARRGCRSGVRSRRSRGRLFVNSSQQRSADAIETIVSDRALQLYRGRRETRVSVLHHIQLQALPSCRPNLVEVPLQRSDRQSLGSLAAAVVRRGHYSVRFLDPYHCRLQTAASSQ